MVWLAALVATSVQGQDALPLYPGKVPNSIDAPDTESLREKAPNDRYDFLQNVSRPKIYPYPLLAAKSPRAAVVILPGGSYRGVSIVKEGFDVAKQLNEYGVAAFVVKYRMPNDAHQPDKAIAPLQDVQQALRMVRESAKRWNVDPQRVGVLGFSAGGHLASTAATQFSTPVIEA